MPRHPAWYGICLEKPTGTVYAGRMPVVVRAAGFSILVYVRDEHPPPHVHVRRGQGECRILIGDEFTRPEVWDVSRGMDLRTARQAERLIIKHQGRCIETWRIFRG
jgi:hypothetical protein